MSKRKVSCLMPTKGFEWRVGLVSYLAQKMPRGLETELLICTDTLELKREITEFLGKPESAQVRVFSQQPDETLGDIRNFLLKAAGRSEYVAMWDCDDRSRPDRLKSQVAELERLERQACFIEYITLVDVQDDRAWVSKGYPWECTMVARTDFIRSLGAWPSLKKGEDTVLMRRIKPADRCFLQDPDLYTYRYHGGNTWGRTHFEMLCDLGSRIVRE